MSVRLQKQHRLRKPSDFARVYQSKQWGVSEHHTYNVLHHADTQALGVTVSKKVSKKAVIRNRLKREIREFYRHQRINLPDAEIVITAKPSSAKVDSIARQKSLSNLWSKVGRWRRWQDRQNSKQNKS